MDTTIQTGGGLYGAKLKMLVSLLLVSWAILVSSSVTYDSKALVINGQRRILFAGSIHYPRSTPDMWPGLIQKAKEGGLDMIQTYVFWNGHEPSPGKYYFEDRYDLVRFVRLVQQAGLYVHLRIGPFVCAEWNFGGFPVWLKFVPGIEFRTDNEPFKAAMKGFTEKIVNMMKAERLFESQGGPIILSQIENEYGPVEWEIGAPGKAYTQWAANMAVGLNTGVPWVMCKQDHVPDPIINTCNDFYCDWFEPEKPTRPKMWTELWTGWFTEFGLAVPHRPAADMAFAVLKFLANRGTFVNYYMYHGGTNFDRTSGGPFIATSYDYDAPLDEYGLPREPKWGHMRDLHKAIKLCEPALLNADPNVTSLGKGQSAHVFKSASGCAAFLANYDWKATVWVKFWNTEYELPPWSISVLPDCKKVAYNSAQIGSQSPVMRMNPVINSFSWQSHQEEIVASHESDTFIRKGLQEQISLTWDKSDYLWYTTDITINNDEAFLRNRKSPLLTVNSAGHVLHVYLNNLLVGTVYGSQIKPSVSYSGQLNNLVAGVNKLSLLSVDVGLPNIGAHFEKWNVGVNKVTLDGMNSGKWDLTSGDWSYKVGLKGEDLQIYTQRGSSLVRWNGGASLVTKQPMQWYQTTFNAPGGSAPLALDMHTMGKGQIWINGRNIGRHWPAYTARGNCAGCDYAGTFTDQKCRTNCGEASQRWYHVPRSWLSPTGNVLAVFEEFGGDPNGISLVERI